MTLTNDQEDLGETCQGYTLKDDTCIGTDRQTRFISWPEVIIVSYNSTAAAETCTVQTQPMQELDDLELNLTGITAHSMVVPEDMVEFLK